MDTTKFNMNGNWVMCPRCKKKNAMTMGEWPGPCEECRESEEYQEELEQKMEEQEKKKGKYGFSVIKHKEARALGYDTKTGKPVAIDKKGNRFDPEDTRYDTERDPHGWKAVGYKVNDEDNR